MNTNSRLTPTAARVLLARHSTFLRRAHLTVPSVTPGQVGAVLRVTLGAAIIVSAAKALASGYDSAHSIMLWVAAGSGSMLATKTLLPVALLLLMLVGMHETFFHVIAP